MTTSQTFVRRGNKGLPGHAGKFAHHDHSADVPLLSATTEYPGTDQRAAAREEIFKAYIEAQDSFEEDPDSINKAEAERLDLLNQHYSLNLAAAHILQEYPGATRLRITENDDGENQFDIRGIYGEEGIIRSAEGSDFEYEWTEELISDSHAAPSLQELMYPLKLQDNQWAEGVTNDLSNRHDGKSFDIDLAAVMARPLPASTPPVARPTVTDLLERQEEAAEIRQRLEEDQKHFLDSERRNSAAIIAAHLLEKHPDASALIVEQDEEEPDQYNLVSLINEEGQTLASAEEDEDWEFEQPGGGSEDMFTLLRKITPRSDNWAAGIATDTTPGVLLENGHHVSTGPKRFSIDLEAAVSAPPLQHPDAGNPRRMPLTHQQQDDLVESAYWGEGDIEASIDDLDDSGMIADREALSERLAALLTVTHPDGTQS